MKVRLDKEYDFLSGYQNESKYRLAFNDLAKKVFGLSFEEWYQAGYWNEKYIPYTIFNGDKAIANVSVNIMDFAITGKQQRYIQIGTVMTDEEYRGKGLSRFLMEKVLEEWDGKCDLIYLYANKSVLDMYPKFGFKMVKEYECVKPIAMMDNHQDFEKLNMGLQSNRDRLYDYSKNTKIFSKLAMQENADLVMFYCTSFLKDNVYYIPLLDTIVVATFNNKQFHLLDVFCKNEVRIDNIINALSKPNFNKIIFGFTPEDCDFCEMKEISGDDTLFIQNNKSNPFDGNNVMFPILSHA